MKHLVSILSEEISRYFLDQLEFEKYYRLINNPIVLSVSDLPSENNLIEEQFIDLLNDGDAKYAFCEMCCSVTYHYRFVPPLAWKCKM